MNPKTVVRSSLLYLLGNVASRAVGLVMIPVYGRFLAPAEYGAIELLELCTQVIALCVGLQAVGSAMIRIYYDYPEGVARSRVISSAVAATFAGGAVVVILGGLFSASLSRLLLGSEGHGSLVWAAIAAMSLSSVVEVALIYQRMRDRAGFFVCYSLVQLAANLALNIYWIAFAGKGIWGFVASKLITSAAGAVLLTGLLVREVGFRWSREPLHRMAVFGAPLLLSALSFFVIHFSDRFFVRHTAGLAEVGIYALACKFAFLVTYLVGEPFGKVWNVTLYAYTEQQGWREQFLKVSRCLMVCLFFVALALAVFIKPVLALVASPVYLAAASFVPLLALGYVARETGDFFRHLLFVKKQSYRVGQITLACAALNLVLNAWLIRSYQAYGAAGATLATWLVYMVLCWLASEKALRLSFSPRPFLLLLLVGASLFAVGTLLDDVPTLWAWTKGMILLAVFATVAWRLDYLPFRRSDQVPARIDELCWKEMS